VLAPNTPPAFHNAAGKCVFSADACLIPAPEFAAMLVPIATGKIIVTFLFVSRRSECNPSVSKLTAAFDVLNLHFLLFPAKSYKSIVCAPIDLKSDCFVS
jgi:hypothetical protein